MRHDNELIIKNPFRLFRYEIPDMMQRFGFSEGTPLLRQNKEEAGWEPVENSTIPFLTLPEETRIHLSPFIGEISEQYYLENSTLIDLQDCLITQEWAKTPTEETLLLEMLNENNSEFPEKITEDYFMTMFIHDKYKVRWNDIGLTDLTIDDIETLSLRFVFHQDYATDDVELVVEDLKFKNPMTVARLVKDNDPYEATVFIDESVFRYYFNIQHSFVTNLLKQEYLLTPAMVLDYDLYEKLKDKIDYVEYDPVMNF